jgi:hypothetical protein
MTRDPIKLAAARKRYRVAHAERLAKYRVEYRKRRRQVIREYEKTRRAQNPQFYMRRLLQNNIRRLLSNTGRQPSYKSEAALGYTPATLRNHLTSMFAPGMNWSNYGRSGWTIDHIKPCSRFDLTVESERKACFHYTNLQPLWMMDNAKKWTDDWSAKPLAEARKGER